MLAYLVSFYDIRVDAWTEDGDDENATQAAASDPERVIQVLEGILGLNEDNFERFRERAEQLANRTPLSPVKRTLPPAHQGLVKTAVRSINQANGEFRSDFSRSSAHWRPVDLGVSFVRSGLQRIAVVPALRVGTGAFEELP
ncbi:hypothetical protein NEMBOFW57_008131 [Staphylotrichum longicolle]|uniref:Uncharacterized protein n=1 Tax=Staphylotrichum longicolle TaxID=669026 RepID=A0AAD4EQS2_9PEZI|nr:hypothetical protein NEMBOFW57_008131 [Staphylotrichum longicolle]